MRTTTMTTLPERRTEHCRSVVTLYASTWLCEHGGRQPHKPGLRREGELHPRDLDPMKIVIKDGKLWTLDDDAKCTRLETTEQMRESIQNDALSSRCPITRTLAEDGCEISRGHRGICMVDLPRESARSAAAP